MHVHSKFSDGDYSIEDLLSLYKESPLDGFALTDHDTIDGLIHLDDVESSFKIIPGIEFSCMHNSQEVHILGLNIDIRNKELLSVTEELKKDRINRASRIISNLEKDGIHLDSNIVLNHNSVGRPHIAKELCRKGYANSIGDAFFRYLFNSSKYYVERKYLSIDEAVEIIKNAGGISVLAHPGRLDDYEPILEYIDRLDIKGIEVYHPGNNEKIRRILLDKCLKDNYLITGGSDFHRKLSDIGKYYGTINVSDLEG